jgi:hypothetical protein
MLFRELWSRERSILNRSLQSTERSSVFHVKKSGYVLHDQYELGFIHILVIEQVTDVRLYRQLCNVWFNK